MEHRPRNAIFYNAMLPAMLRWCLMCLRIDSRNTARLWWLSQMRRRAQVSLPIWSQLDTGDISPSLFLQDIACR
jgi:hypothetical protein